MKTRILAVFAGIALLMVGVWVGRGQRHSSTEIRDRITDGAEARQGTKTKVAEAIKKLASDMADPKVVTNSDSETQIEAEKMAALQQKVRSVGGKGPLQYEFSAFYRDRKIQAQVQEARKTISAALIQRYGSALNQETIQMVLNHADAFHEATEHPMANPFATTQQKMESLQTKDEGAMADVSEK